VVRGQRLHITFDVINMGQHTKAIKDSLEIINDYEKASNEAKNTLEYHATINPHKTIAKVKEILEKSYNE